MTSAEKQDLFKRLVNRSSLQVGRGIAIAVTLLGAGAFSTATARAEGCPGSAISMQQVELYFGLSSRVFPSSQSLRGPGFSTRR